jgi:hypothetical protein
MTKMLITICLALGFCMSTLVAQDNSGQSNSQGNQSGSQASQNNQDSQSSQSSTSNSSQGQQMSGKVSSDRKTFTSNGKSYTVNNPDALKGDEGQNVTVLVAVDPDTNTIHIVQLVPQQ